MDCSVNESSSKESERCPTTPEVSKMSPVTYLAHNLSGLTTSIAGTPMRRISWSNPIPGGDKIGINLDDLSPSNTDSPTLLDLISRHDKPKHKNRRAPRNVLPSDSDDDNKENVTPKSKGGTKPISIEFDKCAYKTEELDSGYSSISVTNKISVGSFECPSSLTKRRSSVFAYDEENSMENIFSLDEIEDQEILAVPENLSQLLNKPLQGSSKSPKPHAFGARRGRLPIRRCLSMEVEFEPVAGPSTSDTCTYLGPISFSEPDVDVNGNCNFKRPDPPGDLLGLESKRRKSSPNIASEIKQMSICKLHRSYSETAATIMHAILKSDLQPELIGDGSRMCALPLIKGRHDDLKSISPETLAHLLNGEFKDIDNFVVVDCRYPYEFDGGHIRGAKNIFTKEAIMARFFTDIIHPSKKNIIIFHCEFSSERAPTLCRFLRNKDREMNEGSYPQLHHPEMYILEGGYKAFYSSFKELCEPQAYKPMNHKDHGLEFRHFRAKSKSWGADCKSRSQLRSHSKTSIV